MGGPIAADTPDYQRGIVSAQKQLAFLDQTSDVVTVGVPPNAETLVVATPTNSLLSTPVCSGLTTALNYPAVRVGGFLGALGAIHWMFDISSALDAQVQIKWAGANLEQWWVYADSGVRLTVNPTQTSNQLGQQYVIPTVPSTATFDHPPNELQAVSASGSSGFTLLAAPGAGKRYRVFTAALSCSGAAIDAAIWDASNDTQLLHITGPGNPTITFPLTGVPLGTNASIGVPIFAAAGTLNAMVTYTTETV